MPLVISQTGKVAYVKYEETLAEILGHSDFDGMDWAVGDKVIFENGTESRIKLEPGEQFYVWDEPTVADFADVQKKVAISKATNWAELFTSFDEQSMRRGCATFSSILLVSCIIIFMVVV